MNMNPETLKALKASIRHWERILIGTDIEIGPKHCALCRKFRRYRLPSGGCCKCPVCRRTGFYACNETPYRDFASAWVFPHKHNESTIILAWKELEFLRSLLPKKEKR
jgi:hypothetical protein